MEEVRLKKFPEWEEFGFESEEAAIEWLAKRSVNRPTKRPRAYTRFVKTARGGSWVRFTPLREPLFVYDPEHPVDADWMWFE